MRSAGFTRPARLALALALVASFGVGCSEVIGGIEDGIIPPIIQPPPGNPPEEPDEPWELPPEIEITVVQPGRGSIVGGDAVEIIGFGFLPDMIVVFGTEQADPQFVQIAPTRIVCRTPAYPVAEPVTVRVLGDEVTALLPNGFEFFEPVTVSSITPSYGPSRGGTIVEIRGTGFVPGTQVVFGNTQPLMPELLDGSTLLLTTPPRPAGRYDLAVSNLNGSASAPGAFVFYEPVRVDRVVPFAGPVDGGTPVTVQGTGFAHGSALIISTQVLAAESVPEETELGAVTRRPVPYVEGPVPVRVDSTYGSDTLPEGFAFYDETDPTPRVIWVSGDGSLIQGGHEIDFVVGGMDAHDVGVDFGGLPGDCVAHDAFTLTCTTPPAPEGTVDIEVGDGDSSITLPDGLSYFDLRLEGLAPTQGARAGGTHVVLQGNGFDDDTRVRFGTSEAVRTVRVDGGQLWAWAPPGVEGPVAVEVERDGVVVGLDAAFEYYSPFSDDRFVDGPAIEGAVDLQVVDGLGRPVAGAVVMAGSRVDAARPWLVGMTDNRGEATISGPGFVGLQNVHAAKNGYAAGSMIDINRSEVRIMMFEHQEQGPPQPGAPAAPPLVTGVVRRVKDEFNTGGDTVILTTTYENLELPLPYPGPGASMLSQGPFEMATRTGNLVIIALAGNEAGGTFELHSMGFAPFLFVEAGSGDVCETDDDCVDVESCVDAVKLYGEPPAGVPPPPEHVCTRVYSGVEVLIDSPVDAVLDIELSKPPYRRPQEASGPDVVFTQLVYDFGYQGLHPMYVFTQPRADRIQLDMPRHMPASLGVVPYDLFIEISEGGSPPLSQVYLDDLTSISEVVVVGPMLKTPALTTPWRDRDDATHFDLSWRPNDLPNGPFTLNLHAIFDARDPMNPVLWWIAFAAGDNDSFELPLLPMPAHRNNFEVDDFILYGWQVQTMFNPRGSWHGFDPSLLGGWQSQSLNGVGFVPAWF